MPFGTTSPGRAKLTHSRVSRSLLNTPYAPFTSEMHARLAFTRRSSYPFAARRPYPSALRCVLLPGAPGSTLGAPRRVPLPAPSVRWPPCDSLWRRGHCAQLRPSRSSAPPPPSTLLGTPRERHREGDRRRRGPPLIDWSSWIGGGAGGCSDGPCPGTTLAAALLPQGPVLRLGPGTPCHTCPGSAP